MSTSIAPENQHPVFRERPEIFRQQDQDKCPDNNPDDGSHSTQHHNAEDDNRFPDGETCRIDKSGLGRKDNTCHACPGCAQGERSQLRLSSVNSHGFTGNLIFPQGNPGPADSGVLQAIHHKNGKQYEKDHQVIEIYGCIL